MLARLAAAALLAATLHQAAAQPSTALVYQGVLQDDGAPANATYDINFTLRTGPAGETLLSSIFVEDVQCTNGLFTVELDFGTDLTGYQDLWLKHAIRPGDSTGLLNNLPTLIPLRPAPRAVRANTASAIDVPNQAPNFLAPAIQSFTTPHGGGLRFYDEDEGDTLLIAPDDSGLSAYLRITTDPEEPSLNILLDGNNNGSPYFNINGTASTFTVNSHLPGNNSVIMPDNSVGPAEILAEPGLATTPIDSEIIISTTTANVTVTSVTIDPPAPGYVIVMASAEVDFVYGAASNASLRLGISEILNDFSDGYTILEPAPTIDHRSPITFHRVFAVDANPKTYYFVVRLLGSALPSRIDRGELTAIYIPTAYGTAPPPPLTTPPTHTAPTTNHTPASELDQLRQELADLRAKVNQLEHKP